MWWNPGVLRATSAAGHFDRGSAVGAPAATRSAVKKRGPVTDSSPFLDRDPLTTDQALSLLTYGHIELVGRMPYSSNATFLVNVTDDNLIAQAIYKPAAGESPLWDFPDGLFRREIAAFATSEALGWNLVPPTIGRDDLVHGTGSLQLFMPCVFEEHYFSLRDAGTSYDQQFRQICAFDVVINNTDRKSGHCLLGTDDRIWAIDHGVAFHQEDKLRTVIWDFAGELVDQAWIDDLWRLHQEFPEPLAELLSRPEHEAMKTRIAGLATTGRLPHDDTGGRRWPWPLV